MSDAQWGCCAVTGEDLCICGQVFCSHDMLYMFVWTKQVSIHHKIL
jgi:hypothetical protein